MFVIYGWKTYMYLFTLFPWTILFIISHQHQFLLSSTSIPTLIQSSSGTQPFDCFLERQHPKLLFNRNQDPTQKKCLRSYLRRNSWMSPIFARLLVVFIEDRSSQSFFTNRWLHHAGSLLRKFHSFPAIPQLGPGCWLRYGYSTFHAASTDPVYAQNMMFFSINTSRKEEMEEVLEELSVTFVPMVAFWDGNSWEKVTLKGQNDILAVLASHRGWQMGFLCLVSFMIFLSPYPLSSGSGCCYLFSWLAFVSNAYFQERGFVFEWLLFIVWSELITFPCDNRTVTRH